MFEIKFKILEDTDFKSLKTMNLAEFEREYGGDVEGLLLLNFNGNTFGWFEEDFPCRAETMFEEWLVTWFDLLYDVVKKLVFEKQPYVALQYIESSFTWIEFLVNGQGLLVVSLLKVDPKDSGINSIFSDEPFAKFEYGSWKNAKISIDEFTHEVIKKTTQLINTIEEINPVFLQAKGIQRLIQNVENFEKLKSLHS